METIQKYKVVVYGDCSVGKTSLINRLMFDSFNENQQTTIGADFISKTFQQGQITIRLQLWDFAVWSHSFRSLSSNFLKDSKVVIICFDTTNEASFQNLEWWVNLVKQERGAEALIYIVGTKADLKEKRKVTTDQAKLNAFNLNLLYHEVSAKNGENIQEVFNKIVIDLIDNNSNTNQIQEQQKLQRLQQGYDKLNTFVD